VTGDVDRDELRRRLGESGLIVLDVRTAAEFSGALGSPCDPRQGRIAGAEHLDVHELMTLTAEQIRQRLPGAAEVVAYCHSGSRSALAVQILRAAGIDARNYPGSWHEWSRDESLPSETG
jgi:thiosulfate/3-mercaptopyruvate sulfurtransferase